MLVTKVHSPRSNNQLQHRFEAVAGFVNFFANCDHRLIIHKSSGYDVNSAVKGQREMQSYDELVNSDNLYSQRQQKVLFFLPMISGLLSILGSSTIMYILLRDWRRKVKRVYHRLLLAYSCIDCVVSLQYALSSLVVPVGTPNTYGARGTFKTCEASGFFLQFGQSLGMYLAFICAYYLLILRYKIREETIAKRIEPFIHAYGLLSPLAFGSYLLVMDAYNPANIHMGHCFINVYPANCLRVEGVTCLRGENYAKYFYLTTGPTYFYFAVVVYSSISTYLTVRDIQTRQNRWAFSSSNDLMSMSSLSFTNHSRRSSGTNNENVQQTLIQALLYVATFFITHIFYGIISFVNLKYDAVEKNRNIFFPLVVLTKIFAPSQGIFNFFIYIRPRYYQLKKCNPGKGVFALLRKIVLNSEHFDSETGLQSIRQLRRRIARHPTPDPADVSGDIDFTPELNVACESERIFPRIQELRSQKEGDEKDDESPPPSTVADTNETAQGSSQMTAPVSSHATSD